MYELVKEFISTMEADGKSKFTVTAYASDLKEFSEFSEETLKKEPKDMKYSDLRQWVNNLEKYGLSATTKARKISTIKSFFRYLSKMDYIEGKNPAENLESPKIPKKQPKVIGTDDARELLKCAEEAEPTHMTCFRDYTIVAVFLYTGIRREELSNIKLQDVDMKNQTILIHGKGNKERTVYINDTLNSILSEYLNCYRDVFKPAEESPYLFPSKKREKLCVNSVNKIVNKAMENANIKERGISAHILRKWFATTVFANTKDIATASKLLGHSSPTVTMRYVSIDESTMRNATCMVSL